MHITSLGASEAMRFADEALGGAIADGVLRPKQCDAHWKLRDGAKQRMTTTLGTQLHWERIDKRHAATYRNATTLGKNRQAACRNLSERSCISFFFSGKNRQAACRNLSERNYIGNATTLGTNRQAACRNLSERNYIGNESTSGMP